MSDTQHHADGEQPVHKGRRVHMNSGPQVTNRLESLWQILGQQGVLSIDQVQRWLARLSPEPKKMKDPSTLTAERTRKILRPWIDQGLLLYKIYYYRQKGVLWLTPKGIKYAQLNLRYYEPSPSALPHMYAVNEVRLLIEARCPKDKWRSEREIRAMQNVNSIGSTPPHVPDAELISPDGIVRAIEVELTTRAEKRFETIVFDLAANKRFNAIWYFLPDSVYSAVTNAVRKLPPEHRKRFAFYSLKGDPYFHESKVSTQESGA
jgi:hypothetical protein